MTSLVVRWARRTAPLAAVLGMLVLPVASWGQAEQGKSAEEILERLLGGERGIGGVRKEAPAGAGQEARIAVPIHFGYNSADITPDSFNQLRQVAAALKDQRLESARVRVEGHTDAHGSAAYNQTLSQRRADAVKRYLVEQEGVAAARLDAKGYGKSRPLSGVSQESEDGRAANRRVEFVNLSTVQAEKPAAAKAGIPKLSVDVVVNYQKGGESLILVPGTVLTPNDNYRITFTPSRDGYVYVYQVDSKGKADAVFPNPQYSPVSNPVKGREKHLVPPEGQWFTLDRVPGDEDIVVMASDTELPHPEAMAIRMRTQPLGSVMRGPAANARGDVGPEAVPGVFTYRLPFKHQ